MDRRLVVPILTLSLLVPEVALADERGSAARAAASPRRRDPWARFVGRLVVVELEPTGRIVGRMRSATPETITIMYDQPSRVIVVDRSRVFDVYPDVASSDNDGVGLLVGGGFVFAGGAAAAGAGSAVVSITPGFAILWVPLLMAGAAALGGGARMLVEGERRHSRARVRKAEQRMSSPRPFARMRGGGLVVRF